MSRALNINASQRDVVALCERHSAPISCIETLPSGCTRVVLTSGDAAATVGRAFGKKVIAGDVKRTPLSVIGSSGRVVVVEPEARAPVPAQSPFLTRRK